MGGGKTIRVQFMGRFPYLLRILGNYITVE
jgi:hypothetical protein